jgi:hypothetical protein
MVRYVPTVDAKRHKRLGLPPAGSCHFCEAAEYDMMGADNMVCRLHGSNHETAIVSLDLNNIWSWRTLLRFIRSRFF